MVLAKSKNAVGLGNSLMNDRFGRGKGSDRKKVSAAGRGVVRVNHATGEEYVTNGAEEASWVKMRSVTEQGALDEFLATAELAGTDFTAEKTNNVKIIHTDQRNPYLLSAAEERGVRRKQAERKGKLTVPRRPKWNEDTTPRELDEKERSALLEWRRGLAELQESDDLLMTPFERNIEVWRQLWRVIERSDLVVQIVDARNPLLFRSEDLERYVKEVDSKKGNLLLVNKADMMTEAQREAWADYFEEKGINYKFFSAHLAKEYIEGRDAALEMDQRQMEHIVDQDKSEKSLLENLQDVNLDDQENADEDEWSSEGDEDEDEGEEESEDEDEDENEDEDEDEEESSEEEAESPAQNMSTGLSAHQVSAYTSKSSSTQRTQILTVDELEELFLENIPASTLETDSDEAPRKTTIGLVGYPNVGKSSTINALIGAKKVSVSATPGKTKHFQTIHLSPRVVLCDCPGLVFPNFATTKAELVCAGVLPIDQLREFTGPSTLVAQRIPKDFLENVYGIRINIRPKEEGGTGTPTAAELLKAYARARGFSTTGSHGQPDESRAARYVLKDYVNGKLLYCHPPPTNSEINGAEFNKALYDFAHLPARRQAFLLAHTNIGDDTSSLALDNTPESSSTAAGTIPLLPSGSVPTGRKSKTLDTNFFTSQQRQQQKGQGNAGHVKQGFHQKYSIQGAEEARQKTLTGRKEKMMLALERGIDVSELKMSDKKHFKPSRQKTRQTKKIGEEDD